MLASDGDEKRERAIERGQEVARRWNAHAAFLAAQKSFAASLAERIAELEAQRDKAPAALRLEINGQIGLIQAIAHDYNQSVLAKGQPPPFFW